MQWISSVIDKCHNKAQKLQTEVRTIKPEIKCNISEVSDNLKTAIDAAATVDAVLRRQSLY